VRLDFGARSTIGDRADRRDVLRLGRTRHRRRRHRRDRRGTADGGATDCVSGILARSGACASHEIGPRTRRILASETSTNART
jgi:hypothetical protein